MELNIKNVSIDKLEKDRTESINANIVCLYNKCISFIENKNKENLVGDRLELNKDEKNYMYSVKKMLRKNGYYAKIIYESYTDYGEDAFLDDTITDVYMYLYWGADSKEKIQIEIEKENKQREFKAKYGRIINTGLILLFVSLFLGFLFACNNSPNSFLYNFFTINN